MRRARWLAPWKDSGEKPVIYHVISRVVDRRFVLGDEEREQFRMLMRIQENFSGCRVLSYCIMSNHFHILLEVPPMPEEGLSDDELLKRLATIYSEAAVADVAADLRRAREAENDAWAADIHARYIYRMHDLGQFMKTLLQRFTCWFNRTHNRCGTLWEQRYKSVIVEDGMASKTMAAYIDLNPVRAGMVNDPAQYRWSSYGEAVGGGAKGNGKKARAGLVRALRAHQGIGADAIHWANDVSREYRRLLMAGAEQKVEVKVGRDGREQHRVTRRGISKDQVARELARDGQLAVGSMLRHRIRYFTDGAVIGSKSFVNEVFAQARDHFGENRQDGARRLRGRASPASNHLWSARDLQVGI